MRALSVAMVIAGHLGHTGIFNAVYRYHYVRAGLDFVRDGGMGVSMFFILSGFLITRLLLAEEERHSSINLRNFYVRRLLRIVPAYYFLLFAYYLAQQLGYLQIEPASWFTALTFTKYLNWHEDWYTAHGWSLSIEEQFYLIWPLLFCWGDRPRRYGCAIMLAGVPLLRLYSYCVPAEMFDDLSLLMNIDALALGCLLAFYCKPLLAAFRPEVWRALAIGSVLVLFGLGYVNRLTDPVPHLSAIWGLLGQRHGTLAFLAMGCVLLYSVYVARGPWFRLLNSRPLSFIGKISYGLYLWQQIFVMRPMFWFNHFPLNVAGLSACAIFSYYVVERPFLRLKQRFN
ncbi:acyltransferase family protein [Hymenobacter ginsengisoli]|uniref:acyltransferase family protein n=1 Tax=Hymenobacter sp. KCTC 23674 TaxID=2864219 RepID=UPI001C69B2A5